MRASKDIARLLKLFLVAATLVLSVSLAVPQEGAAQGTLTPKGEQDRRAVVASLFATTARENMSAFQWNNIDNRVPASYWPVTALLYDELYRANPNLDPSDAFQGSFALSGPCGGGSCGPDEDLSSIGLAQSVVNFGNEIRGSERDPRKQQILLSALSRVGERLGGGNVLDKTHTLKDGFTQPALEEAGQALLTCAMRNPKCLEVANSTFAGGMGAKFDATPAELNESGFVQGESETVALRAGDYEVITPVERQPLPFTLSEATGEFQDKDGGSLEAPEMIRGAEDAFAKINGVVASATGDTKTLLEEKKALAAERDKLSKAEVEQFVKDASKREALIKDAGKLISLFAQAIELNGDTKLAEQIDTVGKGAVEIALGVNDLVVGVINVAASALSGNVVGAVVGGIGLITKGMGVAESINGLFFGRTAANTKPEDPVAKQLKAMSAQMTDLKKAMNSRFDRIEDGLDQVFNTMVGGFNAIGARFDNLDQGIADVQGQLTLQSYKLDQLGRNMRALARTDADRTLWNSIDSALGYRQRSGLLFEPGPFDNHASGFYTHAKPMGNAFDPIALGEDTGPIEDESVMTRLGSSNPSQGFIDPDRPESQLPIGSQLEENVNYLNTLAGSRFGGPLFSQRLPNIRDWSLAARAYARLLTEQPERAPLLPPGKSSDTRLDDIEGVGKSARDQLVALGKNSSVFNRALENHGGTPASFGGRASELANELSTLERAHLAGLRLSHDSLYGKGRVAPPVGNLTMERCGVAGKSLATPANVSWTSMFEPQFLVADKRGRGEAAVCWDAEWAEAREGNW